MTDRKIHLATILFFFLLSIYSISAQQRFKAGLVAGLTASQILGDESGGYNRLGVQGGLRAIAILNEKSDLSFEILYSQRGSKDTKVLPCGAPSLSISTQYIEVPVLITFKDWLDESEDYYKIQVSGGFSYGRLIAADAMDSCHKAQDQNFNDNDISITLGAEYFTNSHFSFGARWSRSLNLLYNKDNFDVSKNSLRGFFLSFRGAYIF